MSLISMDSLPQMAQLYLEVLLALFLHCFELTVAEMQTLQSDIECM